MFRSRSLKDAEVLELRSESVTRGHYQKLESVGLIEALQVEPLIATNGHIG